MDTPVWRFIPLEEYSTPAEPTPQAVRSGLLDMWRRLRRDRTSAQGLPEEVQSELHCLTERILDRVAPLPDWEQTGQAELAKVLEDWFALEEKDAGPRVFVTAPHSGACEMVSHFADSRGFRLIDPPTHEQIVRGKDWFQGCREERTGRFFVAGIERCFLRHYDGFESLRRLLDWMWQERPACVITCDSWAWAYLGRALEMDRFFPQPFAMAPFDAEALSRLLSGPSRPPRGGRFVFRKQGDGEPVFPVQDAPATGREGGDDKKPAVSDFVVRLAARSRGNPGVAQAIWRKSLETGAEENAANEAREVAEGDGSHTIWVRSWGKLELPTMPGTSSTAEAFVLHALLIHGGLPFRVLCDLLPLASTEASKTLTNLRAAGIASRNGEEWGITPLGYPEARAFLLGEGYLVDTF